MMAMTTITMPIQRRNFAASTKTPSSRRTTPTISRMIASPVMPSTVGRTSCGVDRLDSGLRQAYSEVSGAHARWMCHDALVDDGSIAELRRLQARAYAPGADIRGDEQALR